MYGNPLTLQTNSNTLQPLSFYIIKNVDFFIFFFNFCLKFFCFCQPELKKIPEKISGTRIFFWEKNRKFYAPYKQRRGIQNWRNFSILTQKNPDFFPQPATKMTKISAKNRFFFRQKYDFFWSKINFFLQKLIFFSEKKPFFQ